MKIKILFFLVLTLLLADCATQPTATQTSTEIGVTEMPASVISEPAVLNVFAAASLTEPFGEIGKVFEANHLGVTAVFNFGGSQQLAPQINEGAPADVFASANKTQMDAVIEAGGIESGTEYSFASNRLVMIYPQDNPAGFSWY
jgi:molybdate transport system substrate-binding protein